MDEVVFKVIAVDEPFHNVTVAVAALAVDVVMNASAPKGTAGAPLKFILHASPTLKPPYGTLTTVEVEEVAAVIAPNVIALAGYNAVPT